MSSSTLPTLPFGPFDGVVDTTNASVPSTGKLRNLRNMVLSGDGKLSVQNGTVVALTFKDDAGTPANVTSVLAIQAFADGAVAVTHSSVTSKVYLYRLPATMDGWYDATGALQSNASPQPCAVLWTSVTVAPDVWLAEGLGTLYAAQTGAIDVAGLYFRTQTVTFTVAGVPTVADLKVNGTSGSAGTDNGYFTLVLAFHQHVWGWGYGAGAVAGYTSFRPELGKFSQPSFGAFQTADSIVFGDRVRSVRERPIAGAIAGNAMFVGASRYLFRVTGYGRDSWIVETLDQKYGPSGPKAGVAVGSTYYYWTTRGPARCADGGTPQPLWDAVVGVVATVANESKVIAGFDNITDRVLFLYDTGSGVRTLCAYDTRREAFVSLDGDIGVVVNCAGIVDPIYQSTVTPPAPPSAPTIVSTTLITTGGARFTWSVADPLAQHEVGARVQGQPTFLVYTTADPAITTFDITGLSQSTSYEWRVRALKNGVYSSYVGPIAASQFTTPSAGGGGGIPPAAPTSLSAIGNPLHGGFVAALTWVYADASLTTQIFRSTDGVSFSQVWTVSAGVQSYSDYTGSYGTFYYEVRHVAADGTPGTFSTVAGCTLSP